MIDFTGVTAITIPEGSVTKITRGTEVLWEKPSVEQEPIVVFPKTTVSGQIIGAWSMIKEALTFTRPASVGEKYVIYFNGTAYETTATSMGDDPGNLGLIVSGVIELNTGMVDNAYDPSYWLGRMMGWVTSATLEIRYVP